MVSFKELRLVYTGDTKALSASLGKVATENQTTATKMSSVWKTGYLLAGAAAVAFAASAIKSAQDHELALHQLNTVLTNMPSLIGETTAAYEEQANSLQSLSGVQDEEILRADAILARFNLTGEQIRQLVPLIVDASIVTGQSATDAASTIGRAMLGNTRGLKTLGIQFTATGDTAKDFESIMGALEQRVGGAAETFGKTFAGKLAIAGAQFDDLKETAGRFFIEVLSPALPVLTDFLKLVTQVAPALLALGVAFLGFKAVTFVPVLIEATAVGVLHLAAALNSGVLLSLSEGMLGVGAASIKGAAGVALMAYTIGTISTVAMPKTNEQITKNVGILQTWSKVVGQAGMVNQQTYNALLQTTLSLGANSDAIDLAIEKGITYDDALARLTSTEMIQNGITKSLAIVQQTLADAHDAARAAADAQREAESQLAGGLLGLVSSAKQVAADQQELNRLRAHGKENTAAYDEAGLQLLNDQLALSGSMKDYIQTQKDSGLSTKQAMDKVIALGRSVGLTKQEVLDILGPLDQYTAKWKENSHLPDISHHLNTYITTTFKTEGHPPPVTWGATGISNFKGGLAMVGEKGPELLALPRGSNVYPSIPSMLPSMPSGGGGGGGGELKISISFDRARFGRQQEIAYVTTGR